MNQSPITPTVGRIVLYRAMSIDGGKTDMPAIVTGLWGEGDNLSLTLFLEGQAPLPAGNVPYDDGEVLSRPSGWRWMPYQKAVAAGETAPTLHAPTHAGVALMDAATANMSLGEFAEKAHGAGYVPGVRFIKMAPDGVPNDVFIGGFAGGSMSSTTTQGPAT